jgi:hypothetical protein
VGQVTDDDTLLLNMGSLPDFLVALSLTVYAVPQVQAA